MSLSGVFCVFIRALEMPLTVSTPGCVYLWLKLLLMREQVQQHQRDEALNVTAAASCFNSPLSDPMWRAQCCHARSELASYFTLNLHGLVTGQMPLSPPALHINTHKDTNNLLTRHTKPNRQFFHSEDVSHLWVSANFPCRAVSCLRVSCATFNTPSSSILFLGCLILNLSDQIYSKMRHLSNVS